MPQRKLAPVARKKFKLQKRKPAGFKPGYDLYVDGLTQGSINTFLTCRHQFYLKYVLRLHSTNRTNTTAFGSAFHDVLSLSQHRTSLDGKKLRPLSVDNAVEHHKRSFGDLAPADEEQVGVMLAQVRALIKRYNTFYAKEHAGWEWVSRESVFHMEYYVSEGHQASDYPPIPLRGRFDGIFRKGKHLRLLETKTKSRIDDAGIQQMLPFDVQTQMYLMVAEDQYKERLHEVVYDVIQKPGQRQGKDESTRDYVKRICDDIDGDPAKYFKRWIVTMDAADTRAWDSVFFNKVVRMIMDWWESVKDTLDDPFQSPLHFINPNALFNQYGRCDLFHAITRRQYFDVAQREHVYPELID